MRSWSSVVIAPLIMTTGCSTKAPPRTPGMEAVGITATTAELRQKVYRYESVLPRLESWVEDNPIPNITFYRRTTAIDAATITAAEWGSGGLRSVGQIEDLVRDLSDRLTIYAAQQPELARAHAELLTILVNRYMLAPVFDDVDTLTRSVTSIEQIADNLDAFVASTPELIGTERALVIDALERDIENALSDVERQRLDTLDAVSGERRAIFDGIESLRGELLGDVERARIAATNDVETVVQRQARAFVIEAESLIDKIFWRALILLAVGLVGLAVVLRLSRSPNTA